MALPEASHLQIFILDLLLSGPHSGRFIRERLGEEGCDHSLPAFYQLMARLQEAELVVGWYEATSIDGQTIKERKYAIAPAGRKALRKTEKFYGKMFRSAEIAHFPEHHSGQSH